MSEIGSAYANSSQIREKVIKTYLEKIDWVFQMCRERAKELKVDVSKHPETLEELTK